MPEPAPAQACPRCGADLPADAPAGHCPHCLLRTSLDPAQDALESGQDPALVFFRDFGDYELLSEVARGGMGVVYRARQRSLDRIVALKMLLAGEFAGPDFVRRFRREAEAAARLRHPNIVAIYEFGLWEGQHFLSMELIQGRNLADWVRDGPLPARRAASYLRTIAQAVAFAHAQGILHRDLKPSNVLIEDATDQPRITDFGLAKHLPPDRPQDPRPDHDADSRASDSNPPDRLTLSGHALGSPAYMAPEQASGEQNIGPAADLYSLGALLYHLITGRPPFQSDSVAATLRQVLESEPVPPRRLNPGVPLDLQTLCLKCLEKNPARRYGSAQELAEELDRFLSNAPIRARPLGFAGRAARFCRRRPAVAALGATVVALLTTVVLGSSLAALRISAARNAEQRERQRSNAANRDLRQALSLLELQRAEDAFRSHDPAVALAHLTDLLRREPSNDVAASRLVSALVQGRWLLRAAAPVAHGQVLQRLALSPDERRLLCITRSSTARLIDSVSGRLLAPFAHQGILHAGSFSPDGRWIVTASADGTARLWNASDGSALHAPLRHDGPVRWAEFSPDSQTVATASDDHLVILWNTADGSRKRTLPRHEAPVVRVRFSPDGQTLATATDRGDVFLWSAQSDEPLAVHPGRLLQRVHALAFSPDGTRFAAAGDGGLALVWSTADPKSAGLSLRHAPWAPVWHVDFSPDSQVVLTTGEDATARLWNAGNGFPLGTPLTHEGGVVFAAFSPDGQTVVTTSADVSARLWDWKASLPIGQPMRHREPVRWAVFTRNGLGLITGSDDETTQLWDLAPRSLPALQFQHAEEVTALAFLPRDPAALTASLDQSARLWDTTTGQPRGKALPHPAPVLCASTRPDATRAATGCGDGSISIWDLPALQPRARFRGHDQPVVALRFRPDGKAFVTASRDRTARVWNADTGAAISPPLIHGAALLSVEFDPTGRFVVTASADGTARVWDAQTGAARTPPLRHSDHVKSAQFSPEGDRVVTASSDNTARLWDAHTGRALLPPLQHARIVEAAMFTPDGLRVVTASQDRTARLWDARTGQALTPPLPHASAVSHLAVSPDGQRLLTGGWNSLARVWDTETGLPVSEWLAAGGRITALGFHADGHRVGTSAHSGLVRLWDVPNAPTPVPDWFTTFAEGVAGTRMSERGHVELVFPGADAAGLRESAPHPREAFYRKLQQWLLSEGSQRPATPF